MFARLATRVPITTGASFATKRSLRYNSSSSTSSSIMQMAAQAERPNAAEAAVPLMWAACGVLTYTAWNRMAERSPAGEVEKLIIV